MSEETFEAIAEKLQEELAEIILNNAEANEYQMIVFKYVFISELNVPLLEDLEVEITDDSFILHIIPDDLKFSLLRKLDDSFDRFDLEFMPNSYNLIKLRFRLSD